MRYLSVFLLLATSLMAVEIDPSTASFTQRKQQCRVDVYDFIGDYPNLKNIDIDAKRKKRVEFNLTGSYPVLEKIVYEGGFGSLNGLLVGDFPSLKQVNFLCGNMAMNFNLQGQWHQSCACTFRGAKEPIVLQLPKDVGVIAHVNTKLGAKVIAGPLKKKGWWKITHRTYKNQLADTADIVLTLYIDAAKSSITFE